MEIIGHSWQFLSAAIALKFHRNGILPGYRGSNKNVPCKSSKWHLITQKYILKSSANYVLKCSTLRHTLKIFHMTSMSSNFAKYGMQI